MTQTCRLEHLQQHAAALGQPWETVQKCIIPRADGKVGAFVTVDLSSPYYPKGPEKPPRLAPHLTSPTGRGASAPKPRPKPAGTGAVRWHLLQSYVRRPITDVPAFLEWADQLADGLPCSACKVWWAAYRKKNPPVTDTVQGAIQWAYDAQNAKRRDLGKPPIEWADTLPPRPLLLKDAAGKHLHHLHGRELGKVAILAGNGPSLRQVDPASIAGIDVMAINNAATVLKPRYWVAGDPTHKKDGSVNLAPEIFADPTIEKFYPYGRRNETAGGTAVRDHPGMTLVTTDGNFDASNWLAKRVISWGDSDTRTSMAIGLRVLIDLGYRRIYLVGVDWEMKKGQPYASANAKGASGIRHNNNLYSKWQGRFASLADELAIHGVQIINATPGSKLTAFPVGHVQPIGSTYSQFDPHTSFLA